MSAKTGIQWTDRTWGPTRGCSVVSAGCKNCYAQTFANRFAAAGRPFHGFVENGKWTGRVELVPDKLTEPLRWRKPSRVFVNSMSDLFHESLPDEAIDRVFAVMALAPHLTFQVLTKRAERMRQYFEKPHRRHDVAWAIAEVTRPLSYEEQFRGGGIAAYIHGLGGRVDWPHRNVWLGVSVEDQKTADERIPHLLATPAAVRFLSCEPLLGPIDLHWCEWCGRFGNHDCDTSPEVGIDWVIVGGESGPGARPCDVAWIRSLVAQCKAAGVAPFVKQLGARPMMCVDSIERRRKGDRPEKEWPIGTHFGTATGHVGTEWQGRFVILHDRTGSDPSEWPEDLRVREMPR